VRTAGAAVDGPRVVVVHAAGETADENERQEKQSVEKSKRAHPRRDGRTLDFAPDPSSR
jgi:hypothetical protein